MHGKTGRAAAFVLVAASFLACTNGTQHSTSPTPTASAPSTSSSTQSTASASATPGPPGAVRFNATTIASNLQIPWALDFARDGAIWFTERPGRVRVIRNGRLLSAPALTLNVVAQPGCESGLLGLAIKEPYVYLMYTYSGSNGNTNRVSRFTVNGDRLVSEQVIVDGITGGTCFHFGGRIKFGPDGRLYITTGEGFVASRAADPNNLNGKILSVNPDGSGRRVFAWGLRNPEGIAFDSQGRLYASNNGPSGEFGLCCHDSIFYAQSGHFYGWPAYAANTATGYSTSGLPARTPPILESGDSTWAPSGIAFYTPSRSQWAALFVAELRGQALMRVVIDPANPSRVISHEIVFQGAGRMRDVEAAPNGCLYALTSNQDGRGSPAAGDDRILQLCPS